MILKKLKLIILYIISKKSEIIYVNQFAEIDFSDNLQPSSIQQSKGLKKIIYHLSSLNLKYSISKGTLLGLYRDKQILPNDIDIDIDIFSIESVYKLINNTNYQIYRTMVYKGLYTNIVFYDIENQLLIDFAVFNDKFNYTPHGSFVINKDIFDSITQRSFSGIEMCIYEPEYYLKLWYGKDWRVPKTYKKNWTYYYKKNCKLFDAKEILSKTIFHN